MCKSRIFAEVLDVVVSETEVPAEQILSPRKDEETVDARYLLVYYLFQKGLTYSQISRLINKNVRTITYIATHFGEREKERKIFGINSENIRKQIGNN